MTRAALADVRASGSMATISAASRRPYSAAGLSFDGRPTRARPSPVSPCVTDAVRVCRSRLLAKEL